MALSYPWDNRKNPLDLPPGILRNQISIQSEVVEDDNALGDVASTWNTVLTVMASISTISSREMYQSGQGGQFVAQVTHMIKIRWPGESIPIAGGMQILFGSRTFVVQTVENVQERNRVLNLMCLEINGVQ